MALTFTEVGGTRIEAGQLRGRVYDVTLDSSYPTGGEDIDPQNVGLDTILGVTELGGRLTTGAAATTQYLTFWDQANQKLQLFQDLAVAAAAPFGEVANATDVSTRVFRLLFWGY